MEAKKTLALGLVGSLAGLGGYFTADDTLSGDRKLRLIPECKEVLDTYEALRPIEDNEDIKRAIGLGQAICKRDGDVFSIVGRATQK